MNAGINRRDFLKVSGLALGASMARLYVPARVLRAYALGMGVPSEIPMAIGQEPSGYWPTSTPTPIFTLTPTSTDVPTATLTPMPTEPPTETPTPTGSTDPPPTGTPEPTSTEVPAATEVPTSSPSPEPAYEIDLPMVLAPQIVAAASDLP